MTKQRPVVSTEYVDQLHHLSHSTGLRACRKSWRVY